MSLAWRLCGLAVAASFAATPPATAVDLQGHRGARGLAPENTLSGFRRALEIGVTTLETDLALTADDLLVLSHDPALNRALTRTGDGRWLPANGAPIRSLTSTALRAYDVGRLDPSASGSPRCPSSSRSRATPDPRVVARSASTSRPS